jgi:hypothetical protein
LTRAAFSTKKPFSTALATTGLDYTDKSDTANKASNHQTMKDLSQRIQDGYKEV